MAYACVSILKLLPLWLLVTRTGPIGRDSIRKRVLPLFCAGLITYGAIVAVQSSLPDFAAAKLLFGTAVCYAVFVSVLTATRFGREILSDVKHVGLTALRKLRHPNSKRPA